MAKHYGITDENTRYQISQGHVDCTFAANAQNLSCSLKVNEFAASVRAEARGLSRSIPVVMVCSWIVACFRQEENTMCTEASYSYTATKGTCKTSNLSVELAQGSVTVRRTCPPRASKL